MEKIILSQMGILPDTDITLPLYNLFCEHNSDTTFIFEKGNYYFSPCDEMKFDYSLSNTTELPERTLGILMKNMSSCTLDGNGAKFWFEGHMQPLTLDKCENIHVKDITFNWKKPLVAEGIVTSVTDEYADVHISSENFPHRLSGEWLEFDAGAGEWYPLCNRSQIVYEPHFRTVRRSTGDNFWVKNISALPEKDCYRFWLHYSTNVCVGDILVLRHNERYHAGIFTEKCKDISFENIVVHSCGGLGCLSQFCENMTYRQVHFIPDRSLGRFVSNGRDDGMHITCNKGKVTITECTFLGLMDDPINVHGCCVTGDEVVNSKTLRGHYRHEQAMGFLYWAEKDHEIAFIDRKNMSRIGTAKVSSYKLESRDTFLLEFSEDLPEYILGLAETKDGLALENLTNTAEFVCTKNRFGSCRARGILISTPKPVFIEDNYFESSGSAILVAGDANNWFESGECNDVVIRNNIFTSACLTSDYEFCQGIISICPTIPQPEIEKPFHKNITICNNKFDTADTPVLYGFSCKNLRFEDNIIFKSSSAEKWHPSDFRIKLSYCVDCTLLNNDWVGEFQDKTVCLEDNCNNIVT